MTTDDQGVEVIQYRDDATKEPQLSHYKDHFTLPAPSSTVRFRSKRNAARIFENKASQLVLEETFDPETELSEITVKHMYDSSSGLQFLRATYSLVCAFWTGFFFVFCMQVLLFLVLDLAIVSGATEIDASVNVGQLLGVVLAIIVFKQFVFKRYLGEVAVDWLFFLFFLFLPVLVMCITLLAGLDNWWSITSLFWFGCVVAFFVMFTANVVFYEVQSAYNFAKNRSDTDRDNWKRVCARCILLRQTHTYSGKQLVTYLARSAFQTTEDTESIKTSNIYESTRNCTKSVWSRLTAWKVLSTEGGLRCFKPLEEPARLFTIDDVQDYRPFLTKGTWSLERIFCRPANSRYIAIIKGPGSLTRAQIRSSLMCSILGTCLIILVVVSFLVWMDISGGFVALVFFIAVFMAWSSLANVRNLFRVSKDLVLLRTNLKNEDSANVTSGDLESKSPPGGDGEEGVDEPEDTEGQPEKQGGGEEVPKGAITALSHESKRIWQKDGVEPSEAIFLVSQYDRITEVTELFSWIMFGIEVGVFFVFPVVVLFSIENWPIGILFLIVSVISGVRYYINAAVIIEETGNMDLVDGDDPQRRWENKSRLSEIVSAITTAKSRKVWTTILGVIGFAFVAIFLGAVGQSTESTFTEEFTYLDDFFYSPMTADMRYPTCSLGSINGGFGENATLADFAFLAGLAYRPVDITQKELDGWFTDTKAVDDVQRVADFRASDGEYGSAVSFKLVTFEEKELAMVLIRGTQTNWDMLADSQLWSAAALMQILRSILPLGGMWTPILDRKLLRALFAFCTTKMRFTQLLYICFC
jgi:hypothetical protein